MLSAEQAMVGTVAVVNPPFVNYQNNQKNDDKIILIFMVESIGPQRIHETPRFIVGISRPRDYQPKKVHTHTHMAIRANL